MIDDFLWGGVMGTASWHRARRCFLHWKPHIHAKMEKTKARLLLGDVDKPTCLLEALVYDESPHKMDEEAILNELFHSTFVSYGGITGWTINTLMELTRREEELPKAMAEVEVVKGKCASSFSCLQETTVLLAPVINHRRYRHFIYLYTPP